MSLALNELAAEAAVNGWVTARADLQELRGVARSLGWHEVPARLGDEPASELYPVPARTAHPRSLSAQYGLGAQPLHTDGAHLPQPPEIVALQAQAPNRTATRLWTAANTTARLGRAVPWSALRHGVFLVSSGRRRIHAVAASHGQIRYDPGCMTPCDQRARRVATFFEDALNDAHAHTWDSNQEVLLIDNRITLHARAQVSPDDEGRVLRRVAFRFGRGE